MSKKRQDNNKTSAIDSPHPPGVDSDDLAPDPDLNLGGARGVSAAVPDSAVPANLSASDVAGHLASLINGLPAALEKLVLTPAQLQEIIRGAVGGVTQQRILENTIHPHISAYSYPEGDINHPKPKLARKTFFCGIEEKEDRLTPGEIEAFNAFTESQEARGGAWRAMLTRGRHKGDAGELHVIVPAGTVDQRMMLPGSLTLILLELNGGPASTDVVFLLQQIETLKSMLLTKGMTAAELEAKMLASGYGAAASA